MTTALHARPRRTLLVVPAVVDVPSVTDNPMLWYVASSPPQLWLTDSDGKRQLGWSDHATQTAALTLTTSYKDVGGLTLTLPKPETYTIIGQLFFRRNTDFGSNDDNTRLQAQLDVAGTPETELIEMVDSGIVGRTHVGVWQITTTADDVVVKLQARKDSGTGQSKAGNDSSPVGGTLTASAFLGGDETASTHSHAHADATGQGVDDHHPADELSDDDGNTKVEVEQSADENIVRITAGGVEVVRVDSAEMEIARFLSVGSLEAVTISSGAITISKSQVAISPEGGVADAIDNIVGGSPGRQVFLFNAHAVVGITLNHITGSTGSLIFFPDGKSVVLAPNTGIWLVSESFGWTPAAPVYHSAYTDSDAQAAVPLEIWMDLGHDRGGHPAIG